MEDKSITPALHTVKEVADMLRVHTRTVYRLILDGHLRAIKIGSQWRVPESALHEFIDKGWRMTAQKRNKPEKGPRQLTLPIDPDD